MSNNKRIRNVTRGYWLKQNQALGAIEACAAFWVDPDDHSKGIRDLTLAESIAARNEQARMRGSLPYVEVHGLKYEPPAGTERTHYQGRLLAYEASLFAAEVTTEG